MVSKVTVFNTEYSGDHFQSLIFTQFWVLLMYSKIQLLCSKNKFPDYFENAKQK